MYYLNYHRDIAIKGLLDSLVCGFLPQHDAGVTQLEESLPSKQLVAGSNPVTRSKHINNRRQ